MGTNAKTVEIYDFSGGRNSNDPEFLVNANQAIDLQNITLLDKGFKVRRGNNEFNSSAMVGGSTPIVGLDFMEFNSGTQFLNAVAGTKFFTSSGLSGTMADVTGVLTITAGQNNFWTAVHYNDLQIWFGGAPNAPFKYSGSGNGAALGGSPPSAYTAFVANNRIFAIGSSSNPSRIQWPILADPEDWTGTGSGSQDVQKNDGEALMFGVPLDADTAILFKNSSTHLMPLTKSPFPVYCLQNKIGSAGRYSWVNVRGTIYFITPSRRMLSTTDGVNFQKYPDWVNDLWDNINVDRIKHIVGQYYPNEEQIYWINSSGSSTTNNNAIIWDLRRNCWLYNPTGFKANTSCLAINRRLFTGHYNGKVYEQDVSAQYTDESEASPFTIDGYWQTPWLKLSTLAGIVYPHWIDVSCLSESAGNVIISYGFDFQTDQKSATKTIAGSAAQWDVAQWDVDVWGGQTSVKARVFTRGKGMNFGIKIRHTGTTGGLTVQGISTRVGTDSPGKILLVKQLTEAA